jgi:putative sterol carrier protein
MPGLFNKEASKGLTAIYQFDLAGEGGGQWYVTVADETCEVTEGLHPSPNITISMQASDYLAMVTGKANGQMLFMTGKLRVQGDMGLALRMQTLFAS